MAIVGMHPRRWRFRGLAASGYTLSGFLTTCTAATLAGGLAGYSALASGEEVRPRLALAAASALCRGRELIPPARQHRPGYARPARADRVGISIIAIAPVPSSTTLLGRVLALCWATGRNLGSVARMQR